MQNKRKAASLIAAALQHAQEEMQERRAAVERKAAKEKQPLQPTTSRGLTTGWHLITCVFSMKLPLMTHCMCSLPALPV